MKGVKGIAPKLSQVSGFSKQIETNLEANKMMLVGNNSRRKFQAFVYTTNDPLKEIESK